MDDQETQIREIFTEAVALPQSEWTGFLDRRCVDPALRARVQTLLDHYVRSGDFLSRPATETYPGVSGSIGGQVAEFRIVREIGRGGMGVVYLAEDTVLKRAVALKVLPPQIDGGDSASDRFRKEAQAVARLSHPGIVQVYRTGAERGFSYIAMEYIEGETLRMRPAGGSSPSTAPLRGREPTRSSRRSGPRADDPRDPRELHDKQSMADLARRISEVADALDHAHRQGVIHRDVKPSNILIDLDGRAHLTDFGIARITSERTLSGDLDITGSYPYMSPEQARVQSIEIDHRTDIFSLGVILYELLSGKRPFDGATPQEIFKALGEARPSAVRRLNRSVPTDLATICHKAIEKLPKDRYQTASHMAADLRCWLENRPILAAPPGIIRNIRSVLGRHRLALVVALAAGAILCSAWLAYLRKTSNENALSWLDVRTSLQGCRMTVQEVDPTTFLLREPSDRLPVESVRRIGLPPGQYRLTFERLSSSPALFAEADLLLIDKGPASATHLVLVDESAESTESMDTPIRLAAPGSSAPPGMARIAAGTYECGPGTGTLPLLQRRSVPLRAFDLDFHEVSNAEYLRFLLDTAPNERVLHRLQKIVDGVDLDLPSETRGRDHHPHTPNHWKIHGYDRALDRYPVVGVRIRDAQAFARWNGKRLPTMFEWDAAACYTHGLPTDPHMDYPKGKTASDLAYLSPDAVYLSREQARDEETRLSTYRELAQPVDSPDPLGNESGLCWMYGNVNEITSSIDMRTLDGIAKGRSWIDVPAYWHLPQVGTFPLDEPYFNRGFRCARSVAPL